MKIVISLFCLAMLSFSACADILLKQKTGYAYDNKSGELVYKELHERWVRYADPDGNIFATKTLDFRDNPTHPEFIMRDERNGYLEGLSLSDNSYISYCQEGVNKKLDTGRLKPKGDFVADAGFDYVIEKEWERLIASKTLKFDFLVPSRQGFVKFKLKKIKELSYNNTQAVVFRMSPANGFIRLFAPDIDVVYDLEKRSLLEYRGISNLRNAKMKNYDVKTSSPKMKTNLNSLMSSNPLL